MSVRETVISAIGTVFPHHREPITKATTAEDVLGWDSFTHVQLMFEIERRLSCEIEVSDTYDLPNVGELISYLVRKNER
jgi:acyl carrier protein